MVNRRAVLFLAGFALMAQAQPVAELETRKIEYLITEIQSLQGAQFVRNGVSYGAPAAAEHLRTKWRVAGSHVATAEDFIRRCASVSSVSGLPYTIRFADGQVVTAEQFLHQKLAAYAAAPVAGPP